MTVGLLTLHVSLSDCRTLKQKRSRVRPILARLHREFNIAAAETDLQNLHREAEIQCAALSTNNREVQSLLQHIVDFFAENWPDIEILQYRIECI
jgi:uncharacterized protein